MPDLIGAVLPGTLTLLILLTGRARSSLSLPQTLVAWLVAAAITGLLSRWHVDSERVALFLVPGATSVLLYLVWKGYRLSPGYAFVITYLSTLPIDLLYSVRFTGSLKLALSGIGGAGLHDGLLLIPALTAGAVAYGTWRMSHRHGPTAAA